MAAAQRNPDLVCLLLEHGARPGGIRYKKDRNFVLKLEQYGKEALTTVDYQRKAKDDDYYLFEGDNEDESDDESFEDFEEEHEDEDEDEELAFIYMNRGTI